MHFGIFLEERRRGTSEAVAFQEVAELVDAAEAWGLDGVWLGEIHFNGARSVQSAPLALAGYIAGRTRRLRVGTAVQLLPLHNPLRIAEEVATVDHLSQGRFEFGIGRSGSARAYDVLGIPYGESQGRFVEALGIIREAWKGRTFSHQGTFFRFQNATVSPTPFQSPHPPMRMASNSEETFPQVAQLGLPIFVGLRDLDIPMLKVRLATYHQAWREAGHAGRGEVYLRIPVYAAPTEKAAVEEPRENLTYFFRRHVELIQSGLGRMDTGPAARRRALADQVASMSYDEILKTRAAVGTAASLIDRLAQLRDELGLDGLVAELNPGGLLPLEPMRRTLRILTQEIMPALK